MAFKVEFDTTEFFRTYARQPKGYGGWAFEFEGMEPVFAPSSTYADARKWVIAQVRAAAPANYAKLVVVTVCT